METKDKVSVWAGILSLAVLQVEDRVNTELNLYHSDWLGAVTITVEYIIGFAIVYVVMRWILEGYLRRKSHPRPNAPPYRGTAESPNVVGRDR